MTYALRRRRRQTQPRCLIHERSAAFPAACSSRRFPCCCSRWRFRADRPHPGRCHPVAGSISWLARIANVLVAYVSYLGCFFWPQGLAILYPHPSNGFSASTVMRSGRDPGGDIGRRVCLPTAGAVLARRLAVVPGNACPGDRSAPGRRAVDGRSLHLPAADRPGARTGLGRDRL